MRLLAVTLFSMLSSCIGGTTVSFSDRPIDSGAHSGIHEAMDVVIHDNATWAAFWANHTADEIPARERPAVDFPREWIVAALLGDKPDSCWTVRTTSGGSDGGTYAVDVVGYDLHAPGVACADSVVQPFFIDAVWGTFDHVVIRATNATGPPP